MSDFVNFKKRGISLPPGCKDLSDVLKRQRRRKVQQIMQEQSSGAGFIGVGEFERGKLSDIKKHVTMVFGSIAMCTLLMGPSERNLIIDISRMVDGSISADVDIEMDTPQETAVRDFFTRHHLTPPDSSPIPEVFNPNLPVTMMCDISPLPAGPDALAKLCVEFFREVCGLSDDSEVCFRQYRVEKHA
jgi:hypothetical protein